MKSILYTSMLVLVPVFMFRSWPSLGVLTFKFVAKEVQLLDRFLAHNTAYLTAEEFSFLACAVNTHINVFNQKFALRRLPDYMMVSTSLLVLRQLVSLAETSHNEEAMASSEDE